MISDWDNLRVFLALAEEGSLTGAARRLKVSHPTIARRIKALEDDLDTRLFDRLPDRFQPTEAALELLHDVKEMDRASQSISRRSAGPRWIVAQASSQGDELITADCDLDLCNFGKSTIFNFAAHRRPEHYGIITDQVGATPPEE